MKLQTLLLGAAIALGVTAAQAQTTWDMSGGVAPPGANVGTSESFSAITGDVGLGITAFGLTGVGFGTATDLFEKNGGADEIGLGLTNDRSGENEITFGSAILVNFSNAVNAGANSFSWQMNSVTPSGLPLGEKWIVLGSNSSNLTTFTTVVGSGTNDESEHFVPGIPFDFYLFTSLSGNVLLSQIDGAGGSLTPVAPAVPEPSTWVMMLLGFVGLAFAFRHKRRLIRFA
jgi:hypothetical protein